MEEAHNVEKESKEEVLKCEGAQKRMDGEDVFGNKILVSRPQRVSIKDNESPLKNSPDCPKGGRSVLRQPEDKCPKLKTCDSGQNNQFFQNSSKPNNIHGMYLSKGHGSGSSLPHDSVLASSAPFHISQTGIGTANFYRNTPPPRIVLGGKPLSGAQTATQSTVLNGCNYDSSDTVPTVPQQPQPSDSFIAAIGTAARSPLQPVPPLAWQGCWGLKQNVKSTSSLQAASQSLSALAASLPNSGTGDYSHEVWRNTSGVHRGKGESGMTWNTTGTFPSHSRSPTMGSTAPLSRTPSPAGITPSGQASLGHPRAGAGDGLLWTNQQCGNGSGIACVKSRTPSPYTGIVDNLPPVKGSRRSWVPTKSNPSSDPKDPDHYFNPISASQTRQVNQGVNGPVELQVGNLDQSMDAREMKRVLSMIFREHVAVLHVSVFVQSDGNLAATVKVSSLQDAQYAISQLHRKKIGFKRIQISYSQSGPAMNPALVRSQIVSMLQEVPGHRLPLFKFREMFENRYLSTISVSDMYKLRDVCLVSEDPSGRMVTLNPEHRNTPSPLLACGMQDGKSSMELPYCAQHYLKPNTQDKGWAEQELASLPNVRVGLKAFSEQVHALLTSHDGHLPLPSFADCYEAQFGPLNVDENGVPLEHLVSCVSGIMMHQGIGCVKYLKWVSGKDSEAASDTEGGSGASNVSPPLAGQLALFSRELVDLLKTAPNCQLSFNRFIPAYHHHFGRQCRVADYGFTKLIQLLEALPNIVQVLGEGNKRVVTLSHRAQVRRFTSDLLRVLKSQYSKQVTLLEFPAAYQRVLNRQFDIVNYGVCFVDDMLTEMPETTVLVTPVINSSDMLIAIPKREQTPEEIEKTKQFASEVFQLLRYAPQCSMDFSKFIPYYHHHFGRQCRVADFGFTKLIELFEAIPHVVKISEDDEGERKVQLTIDERLRVLGEQVASIIQRSEETRLPLSVVADHFLRNYGYALRPEDYGFSNMEELMKAIYSSVKVYKISEESSVGIVDQHHLQSLGFNVRRILWEQQDCQMTSVAFCEAYNHLFSENCNLDSLYKDLDNIIEVTRDGDGIIQDIRLTPLQVLARNLYQLLAESEGRISLSSLESCYVQRFGKAIQPAQFGFSSVVVLLQALPEIVSIRGKGQRRTLVLESKMTGELFFKNGRLTREADIRASAEVSNSRIHSSSPVADGSKGSMSPDTILKKLIRNLSNQASPAKQRVCSDRASGGSLGYRPLGFATSQQPLHNMSYHHFAWEPPHLPSGGNSTFMHQEPITVLPCSLDEPSSPFSNALFGGQASSPPSPLCASLPLVQPPHPSELPMPRLALSSQSSSAGEGSKAKVLEFEPTSSQEKHSMDRTITHDEISHILREEYHHSVNSIPDATPDLTQGGGSNSSRTKRKQRLAIQFNSPLVPIQ